MNRSRLAAALTVAGLDPSGGAGIAADLRGFAAAGAWGCAACAALTVQSTRGVRAVHAVAPALLEAQIEELLTDVRIGAIKTGALGSAANAQAMFAILARHPAIPAVVDPVMLPSRAIGSASAASRLDGRSGTKALRTLASAATLLTPNLDEAASLLGESARIQARSARDAAVALLALGSRAVLLKGGHAKGAESIDWLAFAGGRVERIARKRLQTPSVHGTGCLLSALIAGRLATKGTRTRRSEPAILEAVRFARATLARALGRASKLGGGLLVLRLDAHGAAKTKG